MSPVISGAIAIVLYLSGGLMQFMRLKGRDIGNRRTMMVLGLLAALLHGLTILDFLSTPAGINLSFFVVAAFIAFILVALVWAVSLYRPLENLFILIFPFSALTLLGVLLSASGTWTEGYVATHGITSHNTFSLLAYTVLTACFCQAVLVLVQEQQLRKRPPLQLMQALPPLATMEKLLFQLLWAGAVLLSIAIITGFIFLQDIFAQRVVHHTALSLLSWLVFITLLYGHSVKGWRGRKAAYWTIGGFALLFLAYFGSKLVIEIILGGVETDH